MTETRFTRSGVRLRRHSERPGGLNWLLLPGGPGIGSESLEELAAALEVPGAIWLVDLPGDGSNRSPPGAPADVFEVWPTVVVEAAQAVPDPVFVGHSTGGMYLLATPELAPHLKGLALLDTAPDASWHARYVEMARASPLPEVEAATAVYEADRRDANITALTVASAPWNFTPAGLQAGRELLARMPYNSAAVDWSDAHFDHVYAARWWPTDIPILRLAGAQDRIVWQGGWDAPRYCTPNVIERSIPGAGHFPWIENPGAVRAAFADFSRRLVG
ncbi:alpha/beta fold hydrolase [Corallococcus sp. bb12-1]|uniref:alpha/beta fold hydrolase n=1 Tax=Corallococcus sp. bb12-1 TaxID=2996784 RepID=UPI00226EBD90|nr:alpha/beta fold hydrolase [Corallococcus sp. bb12-1]MCY1041256.1 alpha/beta fold hydrolase [Corallococcus sp. bb12-1]